MKYIISLYCHFVNNKIYGLHGSFLSWIIIVSATVEKERQKGEKGLQLTEKTFIMVNDE